MIQFSDKDHSYASIIPDGVQWISVTTLIHALTEPFDSKATAAKCSRNTRSKWFGYKPEEIIAAWNGENNRSTELGHWYHSKRETELCTGIEDVQVPITTNGVKVARDQKLTEGIYPEHIVYMQSAGICGQVDKPWIQDGVLNINDYKTNKEIKRKGFTNWEGISKKMLKPLHHLDDCEYTHYSLQLSIYAYLILRHNPNLTLGKLTIEHVKFETTGEDKFGYPIVKLNEYGEPTIKEIEMIECPYLQKEVKALIEWLKVPANRNTIKKH